MSTPNTVAAYIAAFPRSTQAVLKHVRRIIREAVPGAEEGISYGIPAFYLDGRRFLYFAGWKQHYSLYPVSARLVAAFTRALAPYELSHKGTVRFPLDEPIPETLIAGIATFRAKESETASAAKATKATKATTATRTAKAARTSRATKARKSATAAKSRTRG